MCVRCILDIYAVDVDEVYACVYDICVHDVYVDIYAVDVDEDDVYYMYIHPASPAFLHS